MKKAVIYGTAAAGRSIYHDLVKTYEIVAFVDFFEENHGKELFGVKIFSPQELVELEYDILVPASLLRHEIIRDELIADYGVDPDKIIVSYSQNLKAFDEKARETFLRHQAKIISTTHIQGSVAEGGVHQGVFAAKINRYFPDRTIYLFDTFEGFSERDVVQEREIGGYSHKSGRFGDTSVNMVLDSLPHKERAIIKKGYFPESTKDVEDCFVFVSLDFDLYNPTLSGLEFFYPRMQKGGVIVVHDYFGDVFVGAPKAVDEFCRKHGISPIAVGDLFSCAIIKQ